MHSTERQTADAIVAAFNARDLPTIVALRTPTCQRVFRPASLNLQPQNNAAFLNNLKTMDSIFESFHLTVTDVIEGISVDSTGKERKKIIMYVEAKGDTPVGEYINEYVWKMAFEENGERVSEWEEYVDAGMTRDFLPKLTAEIKKRVEAAR